MEKFDPNHYKERFMSWQAKGCPMPLITEENRQLILKYLDDMEIGYNVNPSSRKGPRTYCSLQDIRTRMQLIAELLEKELQIRSLTELESKELDLIKFFKKMREGGFVRKYTSEPLTSAGSYVSMLKAFWHWYMRLQRRKSIEVKDITIDLDATVVKPKFNFITVKQLKQLGNDASYYYRILMWFMFDSGIRSPTELMNVKVSDLEWIEGFYSLNIRPETSKTFGRKIRLLLCSDILRDYINSRNMKPDEYIFQRGPTHINQYLKYLGHRVLNIGTATTRTYKGRKHNTVVNGLKMYDFRHSSACFWLARYKSEPALKYRFGWKKSEMIEYYTSYIGMQDTISTADIIAEDGRLPLETKLKEVDIEKAILEDRMEAAKRDIEEQLNQRGTVLEEIRRLVEERKQRELPQATNDNLEKK